MAVPKRKTSKSRRNMRRSHHALRARLAALCPRCSEVKLPHRACPSCGYYRDRQALKIKTEE
ncbi:50S ribosomal protein L32 [Candidatus Poribacteria bacterium]